MERIKQIIYVIGILIGMFIGGYLGYFLGVTSKDRRIENENKIREYKSTKIKARA